MTQSSEEPNSNPSDVSTSADAPEEPEENTEIEAGPASPSPSSATPASVLPVESVGGPDDAEVEADADSGDVREDEDHGDEVEEPLAMLPFEEVVAVVEAMLYAASEALSPQQITKHLPEADGQVKEAIAALQERYAAPNRGLMISEVAGGYQIATRPEHHERISRLFKVKKPSRLSIQALETLSVVAYRQPVTVPEIMELRGVNSAGVIRTLLEKRLIRIIGRKNVVGRPLLYGTTKEFMFRFGLKTVKDLPQLQDVSELYGDELAESFADLDGVLPPVDSVDILPAEDAQAEVEASEQELPDDAEPTNDDDDVDDDSVDADPEEDSDEEDEFDDDDEN